MIRILLCIAASAIAGAAPAMAADPLELISTVMVEARTRAADGTTTVTLVPAQRVVPGDRVVFVLAYRNTGDRPLSDVVIANPLPAGIAYGAATPGSQVPDVSADGRTFAPLASLRVTDAAGGRAATAADITHIRWRLVRPVPAGSQGRLAFQGVLR